MSLFSTKPPREPDLSTHADKAPLRRIEIDPMYVLVGLIVFLLALCFAAQCYRYSDARFASIMQRTAAVQNLLGDKAATEYLLKQK